MGSSQPPHSLQTSTSQSFSCTFCIGNFKTILGYVKHLELFHNMEKLFSCPIVCCLRNFDDTLNLKSHMFEAHKQINKSAVLKCLVCNELVNNNRAQVIRHSCLHLKKYDKVTCPVRDCSKEYRNKQSFFTHMRRLHADFIEWSYLIGDCNSEIQSIEYENVPANSISTKEVNNYDFKTKLSCLENESLI